MNTLNNHKINLWSLIGTRKKTILEVKDILDIGKTKSQKRRTEQTVNRLKNNPQELSPKKLNEITFSEPKLFKEFCLKFIYQNDSKKSKYIESFIKFHSTLNWLITFDLDSTPTIDYLAFDLANLIATINLNGIKTPLFNSSFEKLNFEELINEMNNIKEESTLQKELAKINNDLKEKYEKENIRINNIDEETFRVYLHSWKKNKLPNLIDLLHFLELTSNKDTKPEYFFQLVILRAVIVIFKCHFKNKQNLFDEFKTKYYYFLIKIFATSNDEVQKDELYKKYKLFYNYKEHNSFNFDTLNISNKMELNNLFLEGKYKELFTECKYQKTNDCFNDIELKLSTYLICFIASIKLQDKRLIKIFFKNLSLFLLLEYRGLSYEPNKFIKLLKEKNDLDVCINTLNRYFSENVDFKIQLH